MRALESRLLVAAMAVVAVASCASTGGSGQPASEPVARVQEASDGVRYELGVRGVAHKTEIAAPAERVWDALVQTYGALELEPNFVDTRNHRYGVQRYTGTRLAGRRTEDFLRCSEGAGPSSVVGRRTEVSVLSSLRALAAGGTELETEVTGIARRMDGTSTPPVRCESVGALEQRIAAGVRERISR